MRLVPIALVAFACGGAQPPEAEIAGHDQNANLATNATLATDDDEPRPNYTKAALEQALISERGAEATDEQRLAAATGSDQDDVELAANLGVRRRFIASLESCQASWHHCPPRLDDPHWTWDPNAAGADPNKPPLDSPLRFDLDDWRKVADELHGRACACRTLACIDSLDVTIDQLEARPMADVGGDEVASASITAARECLFRLRGKK
ncbi:MAG TPA: hypothetical protein VGL61_23820 [Kofleriaceae bacterium]|jgi:hypothetical protein